ncbi:potassium/proton antiporter [Bacillaceae bacterium SIJ1]|uniref:potassium/proton antiporter n=1 Tax=Litoribacterium kuwaitense TaxID=1398745 RepID=UPI0013EC1371|nr:potassium/proton antiporter [Litoribacterium kuwaitense]NGP43926.1 potassium/proton antiporter [Litoribacterium kuwaitense]
MSEFFQVDYFILLFSILFLCGVLSVKFSTRLNVPALIFFIGIGMLIGSDGLGIIYFDNPHYGQLVGIIALVIILFEGGLQTKWTDVKPVMKPAISLATLGVVVTMFVLGVVAYFVLDEISFLYALLFGAIVGSTDAAAVFAVIKGQNIRKKIEATLEAESGTNDPMAMFLTISLIEWIMSPGSNIFEMMGFFVLQMGLGILCGLGFGKLAQTIINRINLDSSGLYPVLATAFAMFTYAFTTMIQGSGLLAVYIAAILLGNSELTYKHSILRFNEGFAWLAQITMFIILGLLVFPDNLLSGDFIWRGLLLSVFLILVARPIAVFVSLAFSRYTLKEKIFISWAGLRGAVPIVLATFMFAEGLENAQLFFNIVFFVVLTSTLIQGSTIALLARILGLSEDGRPTPPHSLELISIGKANAEMMEYVVSPNDHFINQRLIDLDFPNKVIVSVIIRGENLVTPYGDTTILPGDVLYFLVPKTRKPQLMEYLEQSEVEEEARTHSM